MQNPFETPDFLSLQRKWYEILKNNGFEDQESADYTDRPLKKWSGSSWVYSEMHQPPGVMAVSSLPQSIFKEEEHFQNHPEFDEICSSLCKHGNSRLNPVLVKAIWQDYCEGRSTRESERSHMVSDTAVFRVIKTITEWMNIVDTREKEPSDETVIVIRPFDRSPKPRSDTAMIYSTWRNSLWYDKSRDERKSAEFYTFKTKEIKSILGDHDTTVLIACDKLDPDFIAGYAVIRGTNLEFVYVKIDYRKKGIAKLLTKKCKTVSAPMTKIGRKIVELCNIRVYKENYGTGTKEEARSEANIST